MNIFLYCIIGDVNIYCTQRRSVIQDRRETIHINTDTYCYSSIHLGRKSYGRASFLFKGAGYSRAMLLLQRERLSWKSS